MKKSAFDEYLKMIDLIRKDSLECKGVKSVGVIDERFRRVMERIERNKKMDDDTKADLLKFVHYEERMKLPFLKFPKGNINTFELPEETLIKGILKHGGSKEEINNCDNKFGVPDMVRLRDLFRSSSRRKNDVWAPDVGGKEKTMENAIKLAEMIDKIHEGIRTSEPEPDRVPERV